MAREFADPALVGFPRKCADRSFDPLSVPLTVAQPILSLQRAIGNRAVGRLLRTQPERVQGGGGLDLTATVLQRQATPAPAPPPLEAYHAPTSAHDPNAPASRNASWSQVQSAAIDPSAQAALDVAWIDRLPVYLKTSIDERFADSVADSVAHRAEKTDAGLKKIDMEVDKLEKDLRTETLARLVKADPSVAHKHGTQLDKILAADPEFAGAQVQLETDRTRRKEQRKAEIRTAADGPMAAGEFEDTVVRPPTAKITRLEGKALARTNFMSWAVDVLGSTDAAKSHFMSIHEVSRQPNMYLTDAAKARFEAARTEFEGKHPGYTFPSTDVAQSLRGAHHARLGIGMIGHALGIAFDLFAYENQNQLLGKSDSYAFLLDKFGGTDNKRGRSNMTLGNDGEETVAQLGRDTVAGKNTVAGTEMVEKIRVQFEEMSATSERLKASMAAQLPELSQARDDYFNSQESEKELAQALQDEKNSDKIAEKRLKDERFSGDAVAKTARVEEIKEELKAKKESLKHAVDSAKAGVDAKIAHAFAAWSDTINADIGAAQTRQVMSDAEIAAQTKTKQDLNAIDVASPDAVDVLSAFADQNQLKKPLRPPKAAAYKVMLNRELAAKQKARDKTDPLSPIYIHNEIAALQAWQQRIHDPKIVFGEGKVVPSSPTAAKDTAPQGPASQPAADAMGNSAAPAKHWATTMQVTNAPVMQYIEHGFIRNDDMPTRPKNQDTKQAFNAEVVTTLARYGFSPGATFRDTMHFDFIEGYSAAPGGRSQPNMNKTKYGPSGDK